MDRIVDPSRFVAEGALVNWAAAWREQVTAANGFHVPISRDPKRALDLQLRWYVSSLAGVPPQPFTVWRRRDKDRLEPLEVQTIDSNGDRYVVWDGTPLLTLQLRCDPIDPARPSAAWGFRTSEGITSAVGVSRAVSGAGQRTLRVRAGSMTFVKLVNAQVVSARGTAVSDVVNNAVFEEWEYVGLPYDDGRWAGLSYHGEKQGMVAALTDPVDAAVQRLRRAAPVTGWWPVTESGHPAPVWEEPDFDGLVKEIQRDLLENVGEVFGAGVVPAAQGALRIKRDVAPPTQDGRVARVDTSTVSSPPFGTLMLAATTDPFAAIGVGFGTGYPLGGENGVGEDVDMMITATYPDGLDGRGFAEYAWVVPWPDQHQRMTPPGSLTARRTGLLDPPVRNAPWRETIGLEWDALPRSVLFGRAAGAAAARFDPATGSPAEALLDKRESGGYRPLAPQRQPKPRTDRVLVNDAGLPLPVDGSAVSRGYAVAQQDPYGIWSPWEDVAYSGSEPRPPVPVISEVSLLTSYGGTIVCPGALSVTLTIDWSTRTPSFVQLPLVMFPAPFNGAPIPAGTSPFGAPPAGGHRLDLTFRFNSDTPSPLVPGLTVRCLSQTGDAEVAPGEAAQGPGSRRYRLEFQRGDFLFDYAATAHWGLAAWAREVAQGRPDWGDTSPQPSRAFASSPVPIIVPSVPLPAPPLGSLPDAEGKSHVSLRLTGLPGAQKLVIWTASEVRLREMAGVGAIPAQLTLAERFAEMKAAFGALAVSQQREAFARVQELTPGPVSVDVALPRGSSEISFFAVTAVTPANVESPWPSSVDQLQAAAAPQLVGPATPSVSAAFVETIGGPRIGLSLAVHSTVEVIGFEIHRTYIAGASASTGMMGPAVVSVPVAAVPGADTPAGVRYEATWTDPNVGDWRPANYRVRAVPMLSLADRQRGLVARRSADSTLASLLLPPAEAPQLTLVSTGVWGAGSAGVLVKVTTDAPVAALPIGPFTLAADVTTPTGAPVAAVSSVVSEVAEASVDNPPGAVPGITRTARSGGSTTFALWFERPVAGAAVDVRMVLTDPLGRRRVLTTTVPGFVPPVGPTVKITSVGPSGTGAVVRFRTNAPAVAGPAGPHHLRILVRRTVSPPQSATFEAAFPDIPDVDRLFPVIPGRIVVVRTRDGRAVDYSVRVRVSRPFLIAISVTDPAGNTVRADRTVQAVLPPP